VTKLKLISHALCPYVQRAVIALTEKGVAFERIDIDLANKPEWFLKLSPLGKVPVLVDGDAVIFESAVIVEYIEDTVTPKIHPEDPRERAGHRAWIEFSSALLMDLWGFYNAADAESFEAKRKVLAERFGQLEAKLAAGPWFAGTRFSLVDAAMGPVFRYFDVFDGIADFGILKDRPKIALWRRRLRDRPSIKNAVARDYALKLEDFIVARNGHLARLIKKEGRRAA
jgi:glutathione S-transferase